MLKRNITYEDFNGETVSEVFYFNLSRTELVQLEVTYKDGLQKTIERIIETEDSKALITEFQRIVLLSYGERSEDGKRFIKSDDIREAFSQTAAYDALFMELATDANAAVDFISGIIPRDMAQAAGNVPDIKNVTTQQLDPQTATQPSPSAVPVPTNPTTPPPIGWTAPPTTE